MHFALEPINGLGFEKDGVFEVHTGSQWQTLVLPWLSKALGRSQDKIVMRTYLLGGGFGRRLGGDYAVPVALAAKAVGKPVKVIATRPDDMRFDCPRSPSVQRLRMAFGENGRVTAMEHDAAAGWPTAAYAPFFLMKDKNGVEYDPFSIHGADHWYTVGAQRVRALRNDLANETFRPAGCARLVRVGSTGRWRASWMKPPMLRKSIRWLSGYACLMAPAGTLAGRRALSAARDAKRPYWLALPKRRHGAARCLKT